MGLRPTAARWFEVLTPTDELARTVEAMAATGRVQIEAERVMERPSDEPQNELEEYRALGRRYLAHWPRPDFRTRMTAGAPRAIMQDALSALHAWADEAEPLIGRLERLEAERAELTLWAELGESSESSLTELGRMARAGPQLEARLLVLESGQPVPELPRVIVRTTRTEQHVFLSVLAARAELEALERALAESEVRRLDIPPDVDRNAVRVRQRAVDEALAKLNAELTALSLAHRLPNRLADAQRLEWFLTHVPPLDRTRHFALVTGWTSDLDAAELRRALDESGVHALIRFPASACAPPIILQNPPWAKPFEVLSRLLGTPSATEADPSVLLVVLAPILFGFMFADVGHGALLIVLGFVLRRRMPALGMLIPGGASAALFGFLFGSVFGREDLIAPLWTHPLSNPLLVLGASVLLGAAMLTLGFLLSGLEAYWRRAFGEWLESDGALALTYLGLLVGFLHPAGLFAAAAGALIYVMTPALHTKSQRVKASLVAAGRLVERFLQLGVNTISFARVGAFALAHAGLCVAIVELVHAAGRVGGVVVFLLGNALVLALEGLVVGIQTTRLVLFEFFARFLRGEGRAFVPLLPPASDEAMTGAHK